MDEFAFTWVWGVLEFIGREMFSERLVLLILTTTSIFVSGRVPFFMPAVVNYVTLLDYDFG